MTRTPRTRTEYEIYTDYLDRAQNMAAVTIRSKDHRFSFDIHASEFKGPKEALNWALDFIDSKSVWYVENHPTMMRAIRKACFEIYPKAVAK